MGKERVARPPREVDVRWLRIVLSIAAVGLFFAVAFYEDPARTPNEPFEPFDPKALQDRLWFGDAVARTEWIGLLNYLAALGYLGTGLVAQGRVRWRGIVVGFSLVAAVAVAAVAGLLYLYGGDAASFPLGGRGMQRIFFFHALGLGGLAGGWWQLRRAALRSG